MILLKSESARLIYVSNPKAGSTSIYRIFLEFSGLDVGVPVRKALRSPELVETMRRAGVYYVSIPGRGFADFAKEHPGYFWFSFVRNPYDRVVSNYYNKLNRYALHFDRGAYYRGKFQQLLSGPKAWRSHIAAVNHMRDNIPFPEFIAGLVKGGIRFDPHFERQVRILRIHQLRYDHIGKVETFAADMATVLAAAKGGGAGTLSAAQAPRENASRYERSKDEYLTPEMKRAIYELYRPDFRRFGYASDLDDMPT